MKRSSRVVRAIAAIGILSTAALVAWVRQPSGFTIVLIPDTQNYNESPADKFTADVTYRRITDHIKSLAGNKVALHLGDVTDADGKATVDADRMWLEASAAHRTLDDADIPYLIVPGNHDHPQVANESHRLVRDASFFNWNFPPARFNPSWYVGHFSDDPRDNQNSAIKFAGAGEEFLAIGLDHAPTKDAVCWADELIRANPKKRIIITTHCYQKMGTGNGGPGTKHELAKCATDYRIVGMSGQQLWDELLNLHSNIWLVASGHWQGGAFYTVTPNQAGASVNEVLVDYQDERLAPQDVEPATGTRKHGNGWIKLLEYDAGTKEFAASPFSVLDATKFNIGDFDSRTSSNDTSDVCNRDRPCYAAEKSSPHHTFRVPLRPALPPDRHMPPEKFTDRYVNEEAAGNQNAADVAVTAGGEAIVVWADDSEPPSRKYEVFTRNLTPTGCAGGKSTRVNINSWRQQRRPAVAANGAARAVVVWEDDSHGPADVYQVYARGLDRHGAQTFYPITVNEGASGNQTRPAVAMSPDGAFGVTWADTRHDAGDVFLRGFNASGSPRFGDLRVSTTGVQQFPKIAVTSIGDFIVAWTTSSGVFARRIAADGSAQSPIATLAATVGTNAADLSWDPNTDEGVLAWPEQGRRVKLARLSISGNNVQFIGSDTTVHDAGGGTLQASRVRNVDVATTIDGQTMVVWEDDSDGNGSTQISARRTKWTANAWTMNEAAWTVNKDCHGQQTEPRVHLAAPNGQPRWVVVWTDDLDGNGLTQILARGGRFDDADASKDAMCYDAT